MSANVCCPNCWVWSELGTRTTCRRCGSPLILPDGRRLDLALAAPPPPPPPHEYAMAGATVPPPPLNVAGVALRGFRPGAASLTDWVGVCRWITIGYGALFSLGLIAVGLIVQHINVPITDPATGVTTVQTLNIGPPFAIAAMVTGVVFAVCAWLTRFTAARVVFLILDLMALLAAVSQISVDLRSGVFAILGVVGVAVDVAYGGALVMSLLARPPQELR